MEKPNKTPGTTPATSSGSPSAPYPNDTASAGGKQPSDAQAGRSLHTPPKPKPTTSPGPHTNTRRQQLAAWLAKTEWVLDT